MRDPSILQLPYDSARGGFYLDFNPSKCLGTTGILYYWVLVADGKRTDNRWTIVPKLLNIKWVDKSDSLQMVGYMTYTTVPWPEEYKAPESPAGLRNIMVALGCGGTSEQDLKVLLAQRQTSSQPFVTAVPMSSTSSIVQGETYSFKLRVRSSRTYVMKVRDHKGGAYRERPFSASKGVTEIDLSIINDYFEYMVVGVHSDYQCVRPEQVPQSGIVEVIVR